MWDCYDKWALLIKIERWYNSALSYKKRVSSYFKTINEWLLLFKRFEFIIYQKYKW